MNRPKVSKLGADIIWVETISAAEEFAARS